MPPSKRSVHPIANQTNPARARSRTSINAAIALQRYPKIRRVTFAQFEAFEPQLLGIPTNAFISRLVELDDHGYRDKRHVYRIAGAEWSFASALCDRLENDFWSRYDEHCVLDDDVRLTVKTLRSRGVKMAVVTNGARIVSTVGGRRM
jgi:putative hydrolase of the HAD superfamily